MWFFKDIIVVVGLVVMAILFVMGVVGVAFDIQEIRNNIAFWGITWFEAVAGIFAIAFWVVVIKLVIRLNRFERGRPKLNIRLIPFPLSGYSFGKSPFTPKKGFAKIAVANSGGIIVDCIGRVTSISMVNIVRGQIQIMRQAFTATFLSWDSDETKLSIPNGGVPRYLNLAYIDQNRPGMWQLAIDDPQKQDYGTGWWKIGVTISSESQQTDKEEIEVALGLGDRKSPPDGLNLWPWDKWYESIQNELRQEIDKEGSQT